MLRAATYVRDFSSLITLYPDTTYYLFQTSANDHFVLVATDYPDPLDESRQLNTLSGPFAIEFTHLLTPHSNDQQLAVRAADDMSAMFFIRDPNSHYCYYLASVKQALAW